MRTTNFLFAVLMAVAPIAGAERPGTIMSGNVSYTGDSGGFTVHYVTVSEPPKQSSGKFGGGVTSGQGKVHRFMYDDTNQVYFGYDMVIEPVPGKPQSRVTFEPLSLSAEQLDVRFERMRNNRTVISGFRSLLIPRYPPPQIVDNGDTIALDLLVSPDGQQKVVDYLTISSTTASRHTIVKSTSGDSDPHDFTVSDIELRILDPSLRINGQHMAGVAMGDSTGQVLWVHVPSHGRFLLSLTPHAGYSFQRAGTVQHTTIQFKIGGDEYELQTSAPVLPLAKPYNLYVFHDPGYNPAQTRPSITFGAAPRVEDILTAR